VVPLPGDPATGAAVVVERARRAEVVYLGENHDRPAHHAAQAAVLEALLAAGARPTVAFEMLAETDQAAATAALAEGVGAAELDRRLRWSERGWPDVRLYWPLFELARSHGLPVLAIDLPGAETRAIARGGLTALGAAGDRLRSVLPPDPAREAALAQTLRDVHCGLLPEARIPALIESWHARNVTMARRLAAALEAKAHGPGPRILVIVGRGHQAAGGLPDQVRAIRPATGQLVVDLVDVDPGESAETVARAATGDVVWLLPGNRRPDPCATGWPPRP
jgi:uncharacterized iron-regulated protein